MPTWSYLTFQDSASPIMEQLTFFHDHTMIVLTVITVLTLYLMFFAVYNNEFNKALLEGQEIETIWTVLPVLFLVFIALPSMKVLYLMEESKDPSLTVKVNGHQWYWSYDYAQLNAEELDSFMEPSTVLRSIKVTENLVLPAKTLVRALVSSADVVHSWAVPALGVKADAVPGRLNQVFLSSKRLGMFFGQCSEICGANHSFMPTIILFSPNEQFVKAFNI